MPTSVTVSRSDEANALGGGNEPLGMEVDANESVGRSSATETDNDDSNGESESDSDIDDAVGDDNAKTGGKVNPSEVLENSAAVSGNDKHSPTSPSPSSNATIKDREWVGLLEEAKRFVATYGMLVVPFNHKLFKWLQEQAVCYRRAIEVEDGLLSSEQIFELKNLGMDEYLTNPVHKLSNIQTELAWLGEKSRERSTGQLALFDWDFIRRHASAELTAEMERRGTFGKRKNTKLPSLVGRGTYARVAFDALREEIQAALDSGVQLQLAGNVLSSEKYSALQAPQVKNDGSGTSSEEESIDGEEIDEARIQASLYDSDDSSSVHFEEAVVTNAADDCSSSSSDSVLAIGEATPDIERVVKAKWSLHAIEEELAWLGEESMIAHKSNTFNWNFIREHASPELKHSIEEKEIFTKHRTHKMFRLLPRMQNKHVKNLFTLKREEIRRKLADGYRREEMKEILPISMIEEEEEEPISEELGTAGLSLWQDSTLELTAAEEDLAWLIEEQAFSSKRAGPIDWEYVMAYASPVLKRVIEARKVFTTQNTDKLALLLRSKPGIKEAFDMKRGDIRKKLADGYRRDETKRTPTSSMTGLKSPDRSQKSLSKFEEEIAQLGEESMLYSDRGIFDWNFIQEHASAELKEFMKTRQIFTKYQNKKTSKVVRMHDDAITKAFQQRRQDIRASLAKGFRRDKMKHVLPVSPGSRWRQIVAGGPTETRKRNATEAGLGDHYSDELQKLTDIQEELCWLTQESQFASGAFNKVDWEFVEEHASDKLKKVMQQKKEKGTKKYRTIYSYFNLQSNPRLKRAYEEKNLEIRELLTKGCRRCGMEKVLPDAAQGFGVLENHAAQNMSRPEGVDISMNRWNIVPSSVDGFIDSSQTSPQKGYESGNKVYVRCTNESPPDGKEWIGAIMLSYVDIKMRGGGHRRQYKIQFKDGEIGWMGQKDIISDSEFRRQKRRGSFPSDLKDVIAGTCSGASTRSTIKNEANDSCGIYEAVSAHLFPSGYLNIGTSTPSSESTMKEKAQTEAAESRPGQMVHVGTGASTQKIRNELKGLMSELRFQRDNYRKELQRQHDRFEAHVSLMENLEQNAMDLLFKIEEDRKEETEEVMEDVVVNKGRVADDGADDDSERVKLREAISLDEDTKKGTGDDERLADEPDGVADVMVDSDIE